MAEGGDRTLETVETRFTIDDQATGPLRQMEEAGRRYGSVIQSSAKAQLPLGSLLGQKQGGGLGGMFDEDVRELRNEFKRGRLQMHLMESGVGFLVTESNKFANQMVRVGSVLEVMSIRFAGMGPKWQKMAEIANHVGERLVGVSIAFELGHSLGERLWEFHEASSEAAEAELKLGVAARFAAEQAARTAQTSEERERSEEQVAVANARVAWQSMRMSAADAQEAIEAEEQQQEFLKAQGYHTAAEYATASGLQRRMEAEKNATANIKKTALGLGADTSLPALRKATLELGKHMGITGEKLDALARSIEEEQKKTVSMQINAAREHAGKEMLLAALSDQAAKSIKALPFNASHSAIDKFNQEILNAAGSFGPILQGLGLGVDEFQKAVREKIEKANLVHHALEESQVDRFIEQRAKAIGHRAKKDEDIERMARIVGAGLSEEQQAQLVKQAFSTKYDKSKVQISFNNNRFEINQEFAEGFEPGRVATALTDQLASLGERPLQSGNAPLFGIR